MQEKIKLLKQRKKKNYETVEVNNLPSGLSLVIYDKMNHALDISLIWNEYIVLIYL